MAAITSNGIGGGNWSDTTTWTGGVVPGEGDTVTIVSGDTVTIDDAAPETITVGADTTTDAIAIQSGGKLQYLSTATTNHILRLKGRMSIAGIMEIGTVANPIPSTRSFIIETNCSVTLADGKYGIYVTGTLTLQGASKSYVHCKLAANAGVGATTLTTNVETNWSANDNIVIASTSRTNTEKELKIISSVSGTTITITSPLSYSHSGTSPTQAEIINLTRNVKVTAYNTSYVGYLEIVNNGIIDADYVEFNYLGYNASEKYGIVFYNGTTTCDISYSSINYSKNAGIYYYPSSRGNLNYNVFYSNASYGVLYYSENTSGNGNTISNCISIGNGQGFNISGGPGILTLNNLVATCGTYGIFLNNHIVESPESYTISELVSHSNSFYGFYINYLISYTPTTLNSITSWRNNNYGLVMTYSSNFIINTYNAWGNYNSNVYLSMINDITLINFTLNGESAYTTNYGINFAFLGNNVLMKNSSLGSTYSHTSDIYSADYSMGKLHLKNVILNSTNEVIISNNALFVEIFSEDHNQIEDNFKIFQKWGKYYNSTTYRRGASGYGWIFNPVNINYPIIFEFWIATKAGTTPNLSFYASKSSDFNGSGTIEIDNENANGLTLSPVTINFGTWNTWIQNIPTISGTATKNKLVRFFIKIKGTAGNVYLDDIIETNTGINVGSLDYTQRGRPSEAMYNVGTGEHSYVF